MKEVFINIRRVQKFRSPITLDDKVQKGPKPDVKPESQQRVKPKKAVNPEECTICFDTRIQTYMFYPCGHATFCKDCALHLFKKKKNCPDCRGLIKDTVRVYQ